MELLSEKQLDTNNNNNLNRKHDILPINNCNSNFVSSTDGDFIKEKINKYYVLHAIPSFQLVLLMKKVHLFALSYDNSIINTNGH